MNEHNESEPTAEKQVTNLQILLKINELEKKIQVFQVEINRHSDDISELKDKIMGTDGLNEQVIKMASTIEHVQKVATRLDNAATAIIISLVLAILGLIINLILQHGPSLTSGL